MGGVKAKGKIGFASSEALYHMVQGEAVLKP